MTTYDSYQYAASLEKKLGNPFLDDSLVSYKKIMELDREELYPKELSDILNSIGVNSFYIPNLLGGSLKNMDELAMILRVISRRDLTLSIAHGGKLLSLFPIWLGNNEVAKKNAANLVLKNGKLALALTEFNHGSDLLNNEFEAKEFNDLYLLNGEKWLISHATISDVIILLAKTEENTTLRSFSLIYLDKSKIENGQINYTPKIKTLGVRGLEMSGFRISNVTITKEALISERGKGLDTILKGLQFTRNLCSAYSLGALDTAIRTTYKFTSERKLYHQNLIQIPLIRQCIGDAFITLICCDCFSRAVNRAFHILPKQCSLYSAMTKGIIPELIEEQITIISKLVGARHYLMEEYKNGIMQKILRDNIVLGLGDGNTSINLHSALIQINTCFQKNSNYYYVENSSTIQQIYDSNHKLENLNFNNFCLTSQGQDTLITGLYLQRNYFNESKSKAGQIISDQVNLLIAELENLKSLFLQTQKNLNNIFEIPAMYFEYTKKYCFIHMATACINTFIYNSQNRHFFSSTETWLLLCLNLILNKLGKNPSHMGNYQSEQIENLGILEKLYASNKSFSLFPIKLGE